LDDFIWQLLIRKWTTNRDYVPWTCYASEHHLKYNEFSFVKICCNLCIIGRECDILYIFLTFFTIM